MARIVQSTFVGSEQYGTTIGGEQVKSTRLYIVRIVTPRDRKSWARFVAHNGLADRYSIVDILGKHPISGMPRAIAVSLQATEKFHAMLREMRIVRDEKQEFTRWDTFQSTKVSRGGTGASPKLARKLVPARLQFMTPMEREEFITRDSATYLEQTNALMYLFGKLAKE